MLKENCLDTVVFLMLLYKNKYKHEKMDDGNRSTEYWLSLETFSWG